MILSALKVWESVQCDITMAFIHALLKPGEEIYVHQLCGFKVKTIMFSSCLAVSIVSVNPHATFFSTSQNVLFIKGLHRQSMIHACSLALL